MFRRKEEGMDMDATTENSGSGTTESSAYNPTATPSQPVSQPAAASSPTAATPATPAFRPAPPQAAMMAQQHRPAPAAAAVAAPERHTPAPHTPARPASKRVLTVGPDIQMKGEITTCDRVVIEGMVDATMREVHTVELAETGSLKGTAEVEDAEISGSFEGDLAVKGKLTIYTTGRVRGNVTYGEIEIQRGGQISGNIRNAAEAKQASNQNNPKHKAA